MTASEAGKFRAGRAVMSGGNHMKPFLSPQTLSFAVAALLLGGGCTRPAAPPPPASPIVLVIVDTLRADHLECYGYARSTSPSTCALAAEAVRFDRAYATRPSTTPSIASMFTGLYPHRHGIRRLYFLLPDSAETLAERLRAARYRTGGFVSSFVMVDDFSGFAQGFDVYDDDVRTREQLRENYERPARETVDRAIDWLGHAVAAGPQRVFLFVHLIEPHGPYTPPEPQLSKFAPPAGQGTEVAADLVPVYQRLPGVRTREEFVGRYDAEIATSDEQIGRLVAALRERGVYDDATIIVTADHGESLGEDGVWFEHGRTVRDPESHIPLLVKFPKTAPAALHGAVVTEPVSGVDVFATAISAAGIWVAPGIAGHDLRDIALSGKRPAPAPLTELAEYGPAGRMTRVTLALHGRECAFEWAGEPGTIAKVPAEPACSVSAAAGADPLLRDVAEYRFPGSLVDRTDIAAPGARDRFIADRGDEGRGNANDPGPLDEKEKEALRSLGYLD
jgi:arylsulfatase A-like enzyme